MTCPGFDESFPIASYRDPYKNDPRSRNWIWANPDWSQEQNLRLKHRRGNSQPTSELVKRANDGEALSDSYDKLLRNARDWLHVLVLTGDPTKVIQLGNYWLGAASMEKPWLQYQVNHILPVSLPYAFIRSLPNGSTRSSLETLLPLSGDTTDFTTELKTDIFNSRCNVLAVPGWMNEVLGALIVGHKLPSKSRFGPMPMQFISQFMYKIEGAYKDNAKLVASKMASYAGAPEVEQAFVDYAAMQWGYVLTFVDQPEGTWKGASLSKWRVDPTAGPLSDASCSDEACV